MAPLSDLNSSTEVRAAASSSSVARPSANRSAVRIATRRRSSGRRSQANRQHPQANSRSCAGPAFWFAQPCVLSKRGPCVVNTSSRSAIPIPSSHTCFSMTALLPSAIESCRVRLDAPYSGFSGLSCNLQNEPNPAWLACHPGLSLLSSICPRSNRVFAGAGSILALGLSARFVPPGD